MKPEKQPKPQALASKGEDALYKRIRDLIITARKTIARGVDLVQVHTSFQIGRYIVAHEQQGKARAEYGQEVLKRLAKKLTVEFGRGFSKSNLEYMRRFFLAYQERWQITQSKTGQSGGTQSNESNIAQFETGQMLPVSSKQRPFCLSWTHYVFLLGIKNPAERSFYEIEAEDQGWNLKELKRQFDSSLYERLALSRDKAGIKRLAQKGQLVEKPEDFLKEPLVLEFLDLDEQVRFSESELESAIICRIEHFLLELGKGFVTVHGGTRPNPL